MIAQKRGAGSGCPGLRHQRAEARSSLPCRKLNDPAGPHQRHGCRAALLNPAVHPVFTLHVRAGYRMGGFADRMRITIHQGIAADGPVLFEGEVTGAGWGWDWTGSHKVAIAGIGPHFVTPNDTGCVEERVPRDAPNAILPFTNFKLRMVKG